MGMINDDVDFLRHGACCICFHARSVPSPRCRAINPTTSERSDGEAVDCDAGGDDGGNEDVDGGGGGDGGGSGGGGGGADGAECKPKL